MESLISNNARMTKQIFGDVRSRKRPQPDLALPEDALSLRRLAEYRDLQTLPEPLKAQQANAAGKRKKVGEKSNANGASAAQSDAKDLQLVRRAAERNTTGNNAGNGAGPGQSTSLARLQDIHAKPKPDWHAPWKLHKVISGPLGWVRCLAMSPDNQWFASGSGDRTIKIFDFPTGNLRLTLTGHISTVRGVVVSPRHPYLFSCGEDKLVKCFDLETNKVIRHYHGHLSGVYCIALHPTLDVLTTAGRDGVVRVWDIRTRSNVMTLSGHTGTVSSLITQEADPQVISGSLDSTIRMWDLAAGKTMGVLTHHKKGVRALTAHPTEFCFASASTGSIKQWKCPEGAFMQNFEGHNAIINTLAANAQNVLYSGADDGSMSFYDWKSGHRFQAMSTIAQPGSLDAENGVFCSTFDLTGLRLITGEADKTIKIWKEDEQATPETHPIS